MSTTWGTAATSDYFLMKPLTLVMHLLTNDDFLCKSSVEANDERRDDMREDLGEEDRWWSLRESPSMPLSSSAIGLLSQGMLLSLRLGGRGSLLCCTCDCSGCWLCCCCRYCSHEVTTSVAVSGSDEAALLLSKPVSRLRERDGGSVRRCGRGSRGELVPEPLPPTPRTATRSAGLTALPVRLKGEAERGLLVANNLLCLTNAGSPRQSLGSLSEHEEHFPPLSVLVVR